MMTSSSATFCKRSSSRTNVPGGFRVEPLRVATKTESFSIDLGAIVKHYDALLDQTLDNARTVGWRSNETQQRNFSTLAKLFSHESTEFSVYDVGCGLADLQQFLTENYPLTRYAGCDIHPAMITRARGAHPAADVRQLNILEYNRPQTYDYVVASGTFSHCGTSERDWPLYIREAMRVMYRMARKGVGVVFLSASADVREPGDYHQDRGEILRFARNELSPLAQIQPSTSPWTFALFVRRPSHSAASLG